MRGAYQQRTLCEVLREVNDLVQGTPLHAPVLDKLREAEAMAKRMAYKLLEYNKQWEDDWWAENKDYEDDLRRRMAQSYLA
jgi:hypothetical protein